MSWWSRNWKKTVPTAGFLIGGTLGAGVSFLGAASVEYPVKALREKARHRANHLRQQGDYELAEAIAQGAEETRESERQLSEDLQTRAETGLAEGRSAYSGTSARAIDDANRAETGKRVMDIRKRGEQMKKMFYDKAQAEEDAAKYEGRSERIRGVTRLIDKGLSFLR